MASRENVLTPKSIQPLLGITYILRCTKGIAMLKFQKLSLNLIIYTAIFVITQITGLLLSLAICFVLQDFIWGFLSMAMINSLILGVALISCCFLTQRLLFKIKAIYVSLISLTTLLGTGMLSFIFLLINERSLFIYYNRGALAFLFVNFLFIIAFYIISSGFIMYRELILHKEKTINDERNLKNQMEMKMLSSRVNPHFLFNTLNMILNLIKYPRLAETALLNLSDLLRNNLEYSERKEISLQEELSNVRKYLEIQKLRFEDKLSFTIDVQSDFSLPPLILQPLVENSIKHNMTQVKTLAIELSIYENKKGYIIWIADSERKLNKAMLNRGQGLTITKKRIENSGGIFTIKDGGIEIWFTQT